MASDAGLHQLSWRRPGEVVSQVGVALAADRSFSEDLVHPGRKTTSGQNEDHVGVETGDRYGDA